MRSSATVYWWGIGLAAVLFGLLLLDNGHYLFKASLYEKSDLASDSLFVRDAKHGLVIHGHYSRWKFYHPGPVLFYTYALGETVFHDLLHVVPTPYNGQLISLCMAMTLFLGLALAIFTQRLDSERGGGVFFLPLALIFGVWHYGAAASMAPVFLESWPTCPLVLTFLCFLVAAASTGSGSGRELPLLALTGGWLVHNHVAQPLFVVPMTVTAYGGLLVRCRRNVQASGSPGLRRTIAACLRTFPRAHLAAGGILCLFVWPVLADMLHGNASNFHRILLHMREQHAPMHKFSRAVCYFLTFGGYSPYDPNDQVFGRYSARGMLLFVATHRQAYLCWAAALMMTPLLFAAARRVETRRRSAAGTAASEPGAPRRSLFLKWFCAMSLLACVLTLFWGMKQDGEMFYFNAYFNFSIYYCAALGLAAALAVFLQALTAPPRSRAFRRGVVAMLALGTVAAAFAGAERFKADTLDTPADRAAAQTVTKTAAATLPAGGVCYLHCEVPDDWPAMIAVALQLERLGYKARVSDRRGVLFGEQRMITRTPVDFSQVLSCWTIVPLDGTPSGASRRPVLRDCGIQIQDLAGLDPAGGTIRFAGDGNQDAFICFGWSAATGDWAWSDQRLALLQFRPLPLPLDESAGVDMIIDAWAFAPPGQPVSQRLEIVFNGVSLPTLHLPTALGTDETVTVRIDAGLWRDAVARGFAKVLCRFPDARSPYELNLDQDRRLLGGGFRSIRFQLVR